MTTSIW